MIESILNEVDIRLKRMQVFADAEIYQRAETEADGSENTKIFLVADNPQQEETDYTLDARIYPVTVTVKFALRGEGHQEDEDDRHAAQSKVYEYHNAMQEFVHVFNASDQATDAYWCRLRNVNLNAGVKEEGVRRVQGTVEFHSVSGRKL